MRVYDGENIRETDPKAKTMQEYRDAAGVDEGMDGDLDALRLQGSLGEPSTMTRPRSPPIRCT